MALVRPDGQAFQRFDRNPRDTPFEISQYPDAGKRRICTAGHFTLKHTHPPAQFTVLNTHLDHRSDAARRLGASLILARAKFEAYTTDGPVFVTGDFNSPGTGPDSGAYDIATGTLPPMTINETFAQKFAIPEGALPDFTLTDLRAATPPFRVSGDFATFTGFKEPGDTSMFARIDFIFGGSNGQWFVLKCQILKL